MKKIQIFSTILLTILMTVALYTTWQYVQWVMMAIVLILILIALYLIPEWLKTKRVGYQVERAHLILDVSDRMLAAELAKGNSGFIKRWDKSLIEFHKFTPKQLASPETPLLPAPNVNYNGIPTMVRLEDHVSPSNVNLGRIFLGLAENGEPIYANFREMFHIIIAGTTRWGKSEFIRSLMAQWLWAADEIIEFYLIDTGGTSFKDFGLPFVDEADHVGVLLRDLQEELERRKEMIKSDRRAKSLETWNHAHPDQKWNRMVVIIEEGLDLFEKKEILKSAVKRLVSWAAKYGLHVVFISQSAKTTIIENETRGNFSSKFQFHSEDRYQARTIISDSNSHNITVRGRFEARINGENLGEIQSPMIDVETAIRTGDDYMARGGKFFDPEGYIWDLSEPESVINIEPDHSDWPSIEGGTAKDKMFTFAEEMSRRGYEISKLKAADVLDHLGLSGNGQEYRYWKGIVQ